MYSITDTSDLEITYTDAYKSIVIWKQNIRFGGISGDELTLNWHNKAQIDTKYTLVLDYNDCTSPSVASAAELQTAIENMITSGWGGGSIGYEYNFLLMGG